MQPGTMNVYRLGGERSITYRIELTSGNSNPYCRVREVHISSNLVNDINHWREYAEENFEKLDNDYYEIRNFGKFKRYLDSAIEKPTLRERFNQLPGLAKFLLIGVIVILVYSAYQQVVTLQPEQRTEQR